MYTTYIVKLAANKRQKFNKRYCMYFTNAHLPSHEANCAKSFEKCEICGEWVRPGQMPEHNRQTAELHVQLLQEKLEEERAGRTGQSQSGPRWTTCFGRYKRSLGRSSNMSTISRGNGPKTSRRKFGDS